MKILELRGYKSLRALNAFHTLMLGLKMLPLYRAETYEDFFTRVDLMPEPDQEKLIREAVLFVELQPDEVECVLSFCADPNGIPYGPLNIKNLGPGEISECIVAVCKELAKIQVNFVTESEKKNSKNLALI